MVIHYKLSEAIKSGHFPCSVENLMTNLNLSPLRYVSWYIVIMQHIENYSEVELSQRDAGIALKSALSLGRSVG